MSCNSMLRGYGGNCIFNIWVVPNLKKHLGKESFSIKFKIFKAHGNPSMTGSQQALKKSPVTKHNALHRKLSGVITFQEFASKKNIKLFRQKRSISRWERPYQLVENPAPIIRSSRTEEQSLGFLVTEKKHKLLSYGAFGRHEN